MQRPPWRLLRFRTDSRFRGNDEIDKIIPDYLYGIILKSAENIGKMLYGLVQSLMSRSSVRGQR